MTYAVRDGTSLALLGIPYMFTQERLLRTSKFLKEAARWGVPLRLSDLEELTRLGLFIPLYRVDDDAVFGRRIETFFPDDVIVEDAKRGKLRDPAEEGASKWWSYVRPGNVADWWDGYYFSAWQLLNLPEALNELNWRRSGSGLRIPLGDQLARTNRSRRRAMALSALSSRYLPGVIGQVRYPSNHDIDGFRAAQHEVGDVERLRAAGYDLTELKGDAVYLLASARNTDPMADWWPVIRNANLRRWERMAGDPQFALQQRIAAELLLLSHESLAAAGVIDPLPPRRADRHFRDPLGDRISARNVDGEGLGRALAGFGLTPTPRVLLVVEGETEMVHVPALLAEIGLDRPNKVRVHNAQGSSTNPSHLARYVSPRLDAVDGDRHYLESAPTAIYIAMDPENLWETDESRAKQKETIHKAIAREVESQGGTISKDELEALVHIFVWGDQKYELANFTDRELADALHLLAREQRMVEADDPQFDAGLLRHVALCRERKRDIDLVFGSAHIRKDKPRLAQILLPVLLDKLKIELAVARGERTDTTPVIEMIIEVHDLVDRLPDGTYSLGAATG